MSVSGGGLQTHDYNKNYDRHLYQHWSHGFTRPDVLQGLCALFGHDSPDYRQCRVLDIGCATGGNLLPLAVQYPNCEFIGVDLSKAQIDIAQSLIDDLKIGNVKVHACSITDLDESWGPFDYIICHGLVSWVPPEVVDKTFEICKRVMSPAGVMLVSYNVLPGWHSVNHMRHAMRFHTRKLSDSSARIQQSLAMLQFLSQSYAERKNSLAEFYTNELHTASKLSESYLTHDHLSDLNNPFYFHEFVDRVQGHGFEYLTDTELSHFNIRQYTPEEQQVLSQIEGFIEREQYKDFLMNRRFRRSLLIHKREQPGNQLHAEAMTGFQFRRKANVANPRPMTEVTGPESFNEPVKFELLVREGGQGSSTVTLTPPNKTAAYVLYLVSCKEPYGTHSFESLAQKIESAFPDLDPQELRETLKSCCLDNLICGFWSGTLAPMPDIGDLPEKPKISEYNRVCHQRGLEMSSPHHEVVDCSPLLSALVPHLDGEHDLQALLEKLRVAVEQQPALEQQLDQLLLRAKTQSVVVVVEQMLQHLLRQSVFES